MSTHKWETIRHKSNPEGVAAPLEPSARKFANEIIVYFVQIDDPQRAKFLDHGNGEQVCGCGLKEPPSIVALL